MKILSAENWIHFYKIAEHCHKSQRQVRDVTLSICNNSTALNFMTTIIKKSNCLIIVYKSQVNR